MLETISPDCLPVSNLDLCSSGGKRRALSGGVMIALTVGLLLSLAMSGASANGTTQPAEAAPVMIAVSSPDSDVTALAMLPQVSSTAPVLATEAVMIKPVIKPV